MSMVTGVDSVREYLAKFRLVGAEIVVAIDEGMNAFLDMLVEQAPEETPWRAKPPSREQDPHMQGVYYKDVFGMTGELLNERFYSEWIGRTGTVKMQPNTQLKGWLEHQDVEAEAFLDAAIQMRLDALGI